MHEVTLDPQQIPAGAELLVGAAFGDDAAGRPIHGTIADEADNGGDRQRLKVGAVATRRLTVAQGTERPSASVRGNPLRGTRDEAPAVPIGAPLLAPTDGADARGWRVYRVTPSGGVIYDEWIGHDPHEAELALARLHAAATRSPEAALRRALEARPGHASGEVVLRWLAGLKSERRAGSKPRPGAARRRWRRARARKERSR